MSGRGALLALAAALSFLTACDPRSCNCSSIAANTVTVPARDNNPVVVTVTEAPCWASIADPTHGIIFVSRSAAGTCVVRAKLSNGDIYIFSLEFRQLDDGCCGNVFQVVDASVPELVDAGAGPG